MKYTYRCKACEHVFEATQSMKDAPLKDCPNCEAPELQKVIHPSSFGFKTGGGVFGKSKGSVITGE